MKKIFVNTLLATIFFSTATAHAVCEKEWVEKEHCLSGIICVGFFTCGLAVAGCRQPFSDCLAAACDKADPTKYCGMESVPVP